MKKPAKKIEYCVPPLLVSDLVSQAAAHFLLQFGTNTHEHIKDVLKCGLRQSGGMVDEVTWWFDNCQSDAEDSNGRGGHWDTDEMGPWVYANVAHSDIADVVWQHTRGWKAADFADYGKTVEERVETDKAARELA